MQPLQRPERRLSSRGAGFGSPKNLPMMLYTMSPALLRGLQSPVHLRRSYFLASQRLSFEWHELQLIYVRRAIVHQGKTKSWQGLRS